MRTAKRVALTSNRIEINDVELVDLSEGENVLLTCERCATKRDMKPIEQTAGNRPILIEADLDRCVEIPDLQDSFIVECQTCGTQYIAKWKGTMRVSPFRD